MFFGGVMGWGRKSYLDPAEIASISRRDCIDWIFLRFIFMTIAVSDLCPLEFYKNLRCILVYFNFWVSSHADNHFCKSIYLFQILYSMKSAFLVKYTLRILTGKKHSKIKFQRLWKIRIWTFGSFVHQINSF